MTIKRIDHLLYACSNLARGMDEIEALLGVRPVVGGRHPDFGTHNALVSLGPRTYLEIIARDPELPPPERGVLLMRSPEQDSKLVTWALRCDDIAASAERLCAKGVRLGAVQSGGRENTDGEVLSWQMTDPYTLPLDGAVPFLIDWGDTPHPAARIPAAGELLSLRLEHPDSDVVTRQLHTLGANIVASQAPRYRIIATIGSGAGIRELC